MCISFIYEKEENDVFQCINGYIYKELKKLSEQTGITMHVMFIIAIRKWIEEDSNEFCMRVE